MVKKPSSSVGFRAEAHTKEKSPRFWQVFKERRQAGNYKWRWPLVMSLSAVVTFLCHPQIGGSAAALAGMLTALFTNGLIRRMLRKSLKGYFLRNGFSKGDSILLSNTGGNADLMSYKLVHAKRAMQRLDRRKSKRAFRLWALHDNIVWTWISATGFSAVPIAVAVWLKADPSAWLVWLGLLPVLMLMLVDGVTRVLGCHQKGRNAPREILQVWRAVDTAFLEDYFGAEGAFFGEVERQVLQSGGEESVSVFERDEVLVDES